MDFNNYSLAGGSIGILTFIIGILIKLNHTRLRSSCCGKKIEVSVDVEHTTPPSETKNNNEELKIKISQ